MGIIVDAFFMGTTEEDSKMLVKKTSGSCLEQYLRTHSEMSSLAAFYAFTLHRAGLTL